MAYIDVFSSRPAAVLLVSGEDHFDFLQSQGTVDLRGPTGFCRYCLWLDHKGLIHGDAFVLRISEEQMLLVSYETPVEVLIEKFDRHIIADDVSLSDQTSRWRLLSLPAGSVPGLLAKRAQPLEPHSFFTEADGYIFSGRRLGPGSVEYLVPESTQLPFSTNNLAIETAESIRIEAGIPSVLRDVQAGSLNPIEAGLTGAVSFDKGCYLGQEVVVRVDRLNRVSRRLVRFEGSSIDSKPPQIPFDLKVDETPVGRISSVVELSDTWKGIGWLKSKLEDGKQELDGRPLLIKTIPLA